VHARPLAVRSGAQLIQPLLFSGGPSKLHLGGVFAGCNSAADFVCILNPPNGENNNVRH